jgi:hypothetical protein
LKPASRKGAAAGAVSAFLAVEVCREPSPPVGDAAVLGFGMFPPPPKRLYIQNWRGGLQPEACQGYITSRLANENGNPGLGQMMEPARELLGHARAVSNKVIGGFSLEDSLPVESDG